MKSNDYQAFGTERAAAKASRKRQAYNTKISEITNTGLLLIGRLNRLMYELIQGIGDCLLQYHPPTFAPCHLKESRIRLAWKDYRKLWAEFVAHTPGMGGMTQDRMEARVEPLRWPCPSAEHPGVSTLYLDHPSWYQAAESLDAKNKGKRFLTASGKVEIWTPELDRKLAGSGHAALPVFYTHPEVTGKNPTLRRTGELIDNPVNPGSPTPKLEISVSSGEIHQDFPLMGMIGRPSVAHFAGVTQWTYTGKQLNGIRLVQLHPKAAARAGIQNGDTILVESPRGQIEGTALVWKGIREDTIFVPNTFGPRQKMAEELGVPYYEAANTLLDDKHFDNLSGQQAYKCFACRVKKVSAG